MNWGRFDLRFAGALLCDDSATLADLGVAPQAEVRAERSLQQPAPIAVGGSKELPNSMHT